MYTREILLPYRGGNTSNYNLSNIFAPCNWSKRICDRLSPNKNWEISKDRPHNNPQLSNFTSTMIKVFIKKLIKMRV